MLKDIFNKSNYKDDDNIKRYIVTVCVNEDTYKKLTNPSKNLEYILSKNFTEDIIHEAERSHEAREFSFPENCEYVVRALFNKKQYDEMYKIVKDNNFGSINYCSKLLLFWILLSK